MNNIMNFERTGNVKSSLNLGRKALIKKFFDDVGFSCEHYTIDNNKIIFNHSLDLEKSKPNEMPNNLIIEGSLYLVYSNITKLPNNLKVNGSLYLSKTNIIELPDNLIVGGFIHVLYSQEKLITFIKNSKFANKLHIYEF